MDENIRQQIERGEVRALVLDTCIFERNRFAFESGLLEQVARIQSLGVTVLMPDVIFNEVDAHLRRHAGDAALKLQEAITKASRWRLLTAPVQTELDRLLRMPIAEASDRASQRLKIWVERVGVEEIDADDYVQLSAVTSLYFNGDAPFEKSGPKKQEFPDAIALLTMENWGDERQTKVLAVSTDSGWEHYAATSDNVVVTRDLVSALSAFQSQTAANASRTLFGSLSAGDPLGLREKLLDALNRQGAIDFDIEATSQFSVTDSEAFPTFVDIEFPDPESGASEFEPVSLDDGEAVVRITATASSTLDCHLRFAKWENVDRENMYMGSTKIVVDEEVEIQALVTLGGQIPDAMTIAQVEVLPQTVDIEIDDAEPDWMSDPDNFEA